MRWRPPCSGHDVEQDLYLLGKVFVAMLCGGTLGLERELAGKAAGLRTHALVAAASTMLVGLGSMTVSSFGRGPSGDAMQADPIRVIEAVISGISFLGAGTVIRAQGARVEGLTTAATLLYTAGVGIAVALSRWLLAGAAVALALLLLRGVGLLERRHRDT